MPQTAFFNGASISLQPSSQAQRTPAVTTRSTSAKPGSGRAQQNHLSGIENAGGAGLTDRSDLALVSSDAAALLGPSSFELVA
ncbi:hypothetical protein KBY66_11005 [Synechococcus sp. Tobar12-5m-g]|uniref:hypothetical protein n=1 Tax=unclassified Synechococcus TaxID=2626047 RepID=UPI0020CBB1DE|nr:MULTISPECIES: hypothetical protein [unclassified Synechococcus]MCP9773150.1 hypothetical protein [Synechococcus sp. Tobar12-5m-g]MCP9874056.1 hypothetical protein [Synechococcus sp. Cruz CV-v-12]